MMCSPYATVAVSADRAQDKSAFFQTLQYSSDSSVGKSLKANHVWGHVYVWRCHARSPSGAWGNGQSTVWWQARDIAMNNCIANNPWGVCTFTCW
ncbi:MAG: hypothetical protein LR008_00965 [Candidatus Pacebacteria bacterium]|nr:hypothetical protein [Candidatus Paceibacterota bacterium]